MTPARSSPVTDAAGREGRWVGPSGWVGRGMAATTGALAVLGLAWLGIQAVSVLAVVLVAVIVASGLEPIVRTLRERLAVVGLAGGIVLLYGAFVIAGIALAILVVPAAAAQLDRFSSELPGALEQARTWVRSIQPDVVASGLTAAIDAAGNAVARPAPPKPDDVVAAGLTVGEAIASVVTVLALAFFWMTEHARLQRYALAFLPPGRRAGVREAWDDVERQLGLWVRGQVMLMGTMAVATGTVYSILGLPSAVILGLIAGIAEAIPLVGPLLGAIPALAVAATVSPTMMVAVGVAYVVIQFVEGNVLVPIIMKNTVRVSSFLVVVSLLVGAALAGIAGALLAVPIVAAAQVILERLQARETPVAQVPVSAEEAAGAEEAAEAEPRVLAGGPARAR